jgi:hypothetical protein
VVGCSLTFQCFAAASVAGMGPACSLVHAMRNDWPRVGAALDVSRARCGSGCDVVVSGGSPSRLGPPKSRRSERTIALDPATVEALRRHRDTQLLERYLAGAAYGDQDLVFCDEVGHWIHPQRLTTWFAKHRKAVGIPTGTLHILRLVVLLLARRSALVLRRALGYQRVAFANVPAILLLDRHDHLAPFAEGIGHGPRVGDGDRRPTYAVLDAEVEHRTLAVDRVLHDRAGQLIAAAGLCLADELAGAEGRARGAEARVDQRTGQHDGRAQRHDQAHRSLTRGVHHEQYLKPLIPPCRRPAGRLVRPFDHDSQEIPLAKRNLCS